MKVTREEQFRTGCIAGKKRIKELTGEDGKPVSEAAKREIDNIKSNLYKRIQMCIYAAIYKVLEDDHYTNDTVEDIQMHVAMRFFNEFDLYDPATESVSTFLKKIYPNGLITL